MTDSVQEEIILRNFEMSDKKRLAELCNNKKLWDNLRDFFPSPYTEVDAENFIFSCKSENPETTFAIEYCGELAGCIGLVKQKDVYKISAELGYWIGEPYWNKGIATMAVIKIITYGFESLDLLRVYSSVFSFNHASMRVLEKAGFKLECISEKALIKYGLIYDEYRYVKLKPNL